MFGSSDYNPDSQPICRVNGYPVYLTGILVAVHVLSLVIGSFLPAMVGGMVLRFPDTGQAGEIWRYATYNFVHLPDIWVVVEMIMLWIWGHQLEQFYGRRTFGRLYLSVVLVPAVLAKVLSLVIPGQAILLIGTVFSSFCVFLAFCFTHPSARFFFSIPWLTAKFVATCFFLLYVLRFVAGREFAMLGLFLVCCGLTYLILRRAGMAPRFGRLSEAVASVVPAPRPRAESPVRETPQPRRPAPEYRPKIKPKLDLPPEKPAVQEVSDLLDKIARHGISSLTPDERAALERASAKLRGEE